MLRTAGVTVLWQPAPTPDEIRSKDQERLIEELRPDGEIAEDDLSVARVLLSGDAPEVVVAALLRALRANLPAPEDMAETSPEPRAVEGERTRPGFEDTVWYSINIGRSRNAEARWLLPMICRRGHVTKFEIGAIRVFDTETRFEIVRSVAERFDAAAAGSQEDGLRITPLADPDAELKGGRGSFGGKARRGSNDQPRPSDRPAAHARPAYQTPAGARPGKPKKPGAKSSAGKRDKGRSPQA
jgi:ATP-dependent RNA helicase DeaD